MSIPVFSQSEDDNIIISKAIETYSFQKEKERIVVKEKKETFYECTKRGTNLPIVEFYNNETTIDKISAKKKSTEPQYTLYTTNDMFYSDMRVCYFKLYFERQGTTGEVKFEKTHKDPRYFTSIYFTDDLFIKEKTVSVIVPEWMNVEVIEHNFGKNVTKDITEDQKGTNRVYTYTITNEAARKSESRMQGGSYVFPHIQIVSKSGTINGNKVSFFESLDDQYNWYHNIVREVKNDQSIIASRAKEIVADCNTDEEKVKALFAWVQDNIRYLAFSDGMAGFKPDNAQEVLRKRYGDCKGMANLLKTFLQVEGFDARLAWLGTNHIAYDYTIPSLSVDNHMICALNFNGKFYYLDPTVKYMPLGEYPQTIQGRQTLVEDKDNSKYLLNRIPTFSPQLNTDSLFCEYSIVDNKLIGKAKQVYKGEAKQTIMSLMDATPKNKIEEALKTFLERGGSQDEATNIKIEGATSQSPEISMAYDISNEAGIQALENEYYINLDLSKEFINSDINIEKRVNNIKFEYRIYLTQNIVLNIPAGYKVTYIPENLEIKNDGYSFSIGYKKEGNTIVYKKQLVLLNDLLLKSDFASWNEDISKLRKTYMEQIVLTKQ